MTVDVDDRELRLRHGMFRRDDRRARAVVDDAGRLELGSLAVAGTREGHTGRAFLAGVDARAAASAAALGRHRGAKRQTRQKDKDEGRFPHEVSLAMIQDPDARL